MTVRRAALGFAIFAALISVVGVASAAESATLPDKLGDHPVIVVDGIFEAGDEKIFRNVALANENAVVFFNSPGGVSPAN